MTHPVVPNFLIIGAAKCGTTSVHAYLSRHPEAFLPGIKEPNFFGRSLFGGITTRQEYLSLFKDACGFKAVGEASTAYLCDERAAGAIRAFLGPQVKLVAFLRHPVDMMNSLWGRQVRLRTEPLDFMEAVAAAPARLADPRFHHTCGDEPRNFDYVRRGRYAAQLRRYFELFPRDNIRVFLFEEFFRPGLPQWPALCDFLGIARTDPPSAVRLNPAGSSRTLLWHRLRMRHPRLRAVVRATTTVDLRRRIKSRIEKLDRVAHEIPRPTPEQRAELERLFYDDVEELERMLGRSIADVWFSRKTGLAAPVRAAS
ncbi:MAG: hypothetical protein IRY94_09460 [Rhodospirillaceae bacterium]|nr:hypothetical protein [Rhodospirillaceae bacterium]